MEPLRQELPSFIYGLEQPAPTDSPQGVRLYLVEPLPAAQQVPDALTAVQGQAELSLAPDLSAEAELPGEGWLRLVVSKESLLDDNAGPIPQISNRKEKTDQTDEGDDLPEVLEEELDSLETGAKTSAQDMRKISWGGGGRRKNCEGCGVRAKKNICGRCEEKHAKKSAPPKRDGQPGDAKRSAVPKAEAAGRSRSSKASTASAAIAKLVAAWR